MAVEDYWAYHDPGETVYFAIWRPRNGYVWDQNTGTFLPLATAGIDPFIASTERPQPGGGEQSMYVITVELNQINAADEPEDFAVVAYEQQLLTPSFTADPAVAQRDSRIADGQLVGGASTAEAICQGDGSILVDQDFGGTNNLCYIKNGVPVDNAEIRVYLASDYNAGRTMSQYIKATSQTTVNGEWALPVMLDPGTYVFQFHKQGECGPDAFCVEVSEAAATP